MGKSAYTVAKASTERVMAKEMHRARQAPGAALFRPMPNHELRTLRERLDMTQAQFASILRYRSAMRISEFEREQNPLPIPEHIAFMVRVIAEDPERFVPSGVGEPAAHDPFAA
jgi:DNA-binding transcriptional regulator YiaG